MGCATENEQLNQRENESYCNCKCSLKKYCYRKMVFFFFFPVLYFYTIHLCMQSYWILNNALFSAAATGDQFEVDGVSDKFQKFKDTSSITDDESDSDGLSDIDDVEVWSLLHYPSIFLLYYRIFWSDGRCTYYTKANQMRDECHTNIWHNYQHFQLQFQFQLAF